MRPRLAACFMLAFLPAALGLAGPTPARAGGWPTDAPDLTCTTTVTTTSPSAAPPTVDSSSGQTPTPDDPCWIDYGYDNPYPFGADGNPVTYSPSLACPDNGADDLSGCYLNVTSLAFRAWNRGLAAVTPMAGGNTPYGVWRYNGARWYPDPTFPGQTACPGNTILWAGKLDVWLIGSPGPPGGNNPAMQKWPALCRYDGTTDQWEPLAVPAATIGAVGSTTGSITSGACFAYDNCWFFGTGGAVVHWDGQTLSNAAPGLGPSPWLRSNFTAAFAGTNGQGNPFAVAVAAADTDASDTQPDGSPPPQVFTSTGGGVSPVEVSSPGADLDALSFDAQGDGWIAANPPSTTFAALPSSASASGSAPLLQVSSAGTLSSCSSSEGFAYAPGKTGRGYLWSSIGVWSSSGGAPGGEAVVGGTVETVTSTRHGRSTVTTSTFEPVLVEASCASAPTITSFRDPDPNNPGGAYAAASPGQYITAVDASADNDVFAATPGAEVDDDATGGDFYLPPHLYLLTDGQTPDAPAGNDDESRPVTTTTEPSIFVFAPPVVSTTVTTTTTSVKQGKTQVKKVVLKAAVYSIGRPKVAPAPRGLYTLSITFKVRRRVRLGLEATRRGKVVSSSGVKTFSGRRGTLKVTLNRHAWPTGLKFVLPK